MTVHTGGHRAATGKARKGQLGSQQPDKMEGKRGSGPEQGRERNGGGGHTVCARVHLQVECAAHTGRACTAACWAGLPWACSLAPFQGHFTLSQPPESPRLPATRGHRAEYTQDWALISSNRFPNEGTSAPGEGDLQTRARDAGNGLRVLECGKEVCTRPPTHTQGRSVSKGQVALGGWH